jgi:hypothetical protein
MIVAPGDLVVYSKYYYEFVSDWEDEQDHRDIMFVIAMGYTYPDKYAIVMGANCLFLTIAYKYIEKLP